MTAKRVSHSILNGMGGEQCPLFMEEVYLIVLNTMGHLLSHYKGSTVFFLHTNIHFFISL